MGYSGRALSTNLLTQDTGGMGRTVAWDALKSVRSWAAGIAMESRLPREAATTIAGRT